ncbi:helix-turn-helix transcriptional regulator [Terriglobus saanensis]|uniref:Transcriptional regulator, AraC family n=1 Tax=Terriglobus saanensis (strain ATCC BAA-1853 / DSM 23119 / SP1PR4) TaxID=401053 RepID=E8V053_TERSS|nr:AraC family transcriptional regulator [Terriglobus saanensis]ADV82208.1 transcriptional regulator, AraC family [Terriglobus saanensis SP1PR4]
MARSIEAPPKRALCPARAAGETSVLLRWSELDGAELLHGDFYHHAFLPHWHDAYMLSISAHGHQRLRLRGTEHIVSPGVLTSLHPGELHDGEAADPATGWHFRALYLSEELVRSSLSDDDLPETPAFEISPRDSQPLGETFLRLHTSLQQAESRLERDSLLVHYLPQFFQRDRSITNRSVSLSDTSGVEHVRDFLHATWHNSVPLEDLAQIAGISRFHLLRTFRRRYGLPPHAYQMQLRVRHAKEMLFAGMPLREVALDTGFYDQAHLTNTLRRYTGATPGRLLLA